MDIMEHKLKQIADRIRELRLITGLTVAQMAERTGMSESEYEACESGDATLVTIDDDEEFDDVADYFDDLFSEEIDYDGE